MVQKKVDKKDSNQKDLYTPKSKIGKHAPVKPRSSSPTPGEDYPHESEDRPRRSKDGHYHEDELEY